MHRTSGLWRLEHFKAEMQEEEHVAMGHNRPGILYQGLQGEAGQPEASGDGILNHSSWIASLPVRTEPAMPLLGTYSSPSETACAERRSEPIFAVKL